MKPDSGRAMCCGYCGRLSHRCACQQVDSDIAVFHRRSGRAFTANWRATPYKRAAPPQVKRRERAALKKRYSEWYQQLVERYGERCFNCGSEDNLVLDHVIPIAKGGVSAIDNLQLLCAECNRIKGKLVIDCRSFTPPE